MLLRASNAVGYTTYPDNVVRAFVAEAADQGIDIFRVFDSLNWLPNMKVAMEAVRKTGAVCEAADLLHGRHPRSGARQVPARTTTCARPRSSSGWARTCSASRTWRGSAGPMPPRSSSGRCKQEIGIPIHFHTHDTSGVNAASVLKAADAGVDVADAAVASMSGTTSQPNLNSIVAALDHTRRATTLDLGALDQFADYWEAVRAYYEPFDNAPLAGTAEVYLHEMPGGQYTNLREQAESMGLGDRWTDIAHTYADVNRVFGDIVKVTPSSKVVGDMAIFLVTHGLTMAEFEALGPAHALTLPNSVVEMFAGSLGQPEGGWPKALQRMVLRRQKPIRGRPGASLEPINFDETTRHVERLIGRKASRDEVLSYVMYPDVFVKFARAQQSYGDLGVVPTRPFFYGMQTGEEIAVELEPGKIIVVKFLTVGELRQDGQRTVFFELNGQPREVSVRDKSHKATSAARDTPIRTTAATSARRRRASSRPWRSRRGRASRKGRSC